MGATFLSRHILFCLHVYTTVYFKIIYSFTRMQNFLQFDRRNFLLLSQGKPSSNALLLLLTLATFLLSDLMMRNVPVHPIRAAMEKHVDLKSR